VVQKFGTEIRKKHLTRRLFWCIIHPSEQTVIENESVIVQKGALEQIENMLRKETGGWKESMPCLVCGTAVNGYRNARGGIKYQCPRCKPAMVRKAIGRRHFTIECYTAGDQASCTTIAPQ